MGVLRRNQHVGLALWIAPAREPEAAAGGACGDRDIDGTGTDGAGADRGHGRTADDTPLTPIHAEIDAVVAVGDLFGRLFRRR